MKDHTGWARIDNCRTPQRLSGELPLAQCAASREDVSSTKRRVIDSPSHHPAGRMPSSRLRRQSPTHLSPSPSPRQTSPSSVRSGGDGTSSTMTTSRPGSFIQTHPPPALRDILSNSAPPPWTLSAFMAFLSQNHCLETLEFTMDAGRYRTAHDGALQDQETWARDSGEYVCLLWQKLMHAYIIPYGPREVNLPAHVRDRLLSLVATPTPPHPSELNEAVNIVYELMNDSLLVPFIESLSMLHPAQREDEHHQPQPSDSRQGRTRMRLTREQSSSSVNDESSRSPKAGFLPLLHLGRGSEHHQAARSSSSNETPERDVGLSDDTGSVGTPPGNEPMTPPTTPPTSDWAFGTSPGSLHRAISAHNNGWKKMGAKLGLGRMTRSKRANTTSVTSAGADSDAYVNDAGSAGYNPL